MGPTRELLHPLRDNALEKLGIQPGKTALVDQVHSKCIFSWDMAMTEPRLPADGVIGSGGQAAAVTVADCMPIAVYEEKNGSWALLHSGRQGTGILAVALRELEGLAQKQGIEKPSFLVTMGPCISAGNYEVSREIAQEFGAVWGDDCLAEKPKYALSLRQANLNICREYGVKTVNMYQECTFTDERLASYRREGKSFRRMMACLSSRDSICSNKDE